MARFHRGIAYSAAGLLGVGIFGSWAVGQVYSSLTADEPEKKEIAQETGFTVQIDKAPKEDKKVEPKPEEKPLDQRIEERRQQKEVAKEPKKETLTDKWLEKVNSGGMYAFGDDNGYTGMESGEGECKVLSPVRVQAMMADDATTDVPGLAIGFTTKDVQGVTSDGEWCVAIPEYSVVSIVVNKAGEYASDRAPAQVDTIWVTSDGFQIKVDQPAKHINGIPGIIGEADHHTASKVGAALSSVLFQLANNVTSAFSFRSTTVTNPVEDTLRKKLERPSEIKLTGSVLEFDLMPISTPGYNQ